MVFCYKLITDTPGRSGATSPSKKSFATHVPSSLSQLIDTIDYDNGSILDAIPEHDWKLLAALARKREQDDERERLADQFRKMWQHEKRERETVEAETVGQYRKYLHRKRQEERSWLEFRELQKATEEHVRKGEILTCIRHKEKRSADVLAQVDDRKVSEIVDKSLEEQARALLAADRRSRLGAAQECRRLMDLVDTEKRAHDASHRRHALLRDASQRVAISNALNTCTSLVARQEAAAAQRTRRALHAAHAAMAEQRGHSVVTARESRRKRARRLAALTSLMREAIRNN